jgi:hypothetical protein
MKKKPGEKRNPAKGEPDEGKLSEDDLKGISGGVGGMTTLSSTRLGKTTPQSGCGSSGCCAWAPKIA